MTFLRLHSKITHSTKRYQRKRLTGKTLKRASSLTRVLPQSGSVDYQISSIRLGKSGRIFYLTLKFRSFIWKFSDSFKFTFKIQAFSSKLLSRFRYFLPSYFQDQAFSSKLLTRSGIFFQVTYKIRHFLPRYFQDQTFSSKLLPRSDIFFHVTSKIRHFLPSYFQDQAISSKLLPRSDIFLQDLARPDIFLQDLARPDIFLQDLARPDMFLQDLPRYLQE